MTTTNSNACSRAKAASQGATELSPILGDASVRRVGGFLAAGGDGPARGDRASHGGARLNYGSGEVEGAEDGSAQASSRPKGRRKAGSSAGLSSAPATTPSRTHTEQLDALQSKSPLPPAGPPCDSVGKRKTAFQNWIQENTGFLLIALAQLFFSLMNTFVALMSLTHAEDEAPVPTWELIFIRMLVTWLGCIGYMLWAGVEHPILGPPGIRKLLILRGSVGFFGLFGIYYSLSYLSLSDATVLTFLSPVLSALLAVPILGEAWSRTFMLAGLASMCGVILIAKPQFLFPEQRRHDAYPDGPLAHVTPSERLMAVGVALVGVLGASGAYMTIRYIGTRANALHSIAYFSLYSTLLSLGYSLFPSAPAAVLPTSPAFFTMFFLMGIMGFVAQALLTTGLQKTELGKGMIAVYTHLVFALASEKICFGTTPDVYSWLGSAIIVTGAVTVALAKPKGGKAVVESAAGAGDLEEGVLGGTDEEADERYHRD